MNSIRGRNHFGGQAIFIYALVALIVGLYIFYFLVAIPKKEKALHNKGIKTLGNIEVGVRGKVIYYDQIINQKIKIESFKNLSGALSYTAEDIFKNYFDQSLHPDSKIDSTLFRKSKIVFVQTNDTIKVAYINSTAVAKYQEICELLQGSLPLEDISAERIDRIYSKWTVTLQDFMEGVFDNDLFECIVLVDNLNRKIAYSNNPAILSEGASYNEDKKDSLERGVHVGDVQLNAMPYQEFCKEIDIAGKKFQLLGFMSESTVESYTRQVSYWVLILISFITIILIFAVPTIKIFILNTWERLKDSDATYSTAGMIALAYFVSLMLCALAFYQQSNNQNDAGVEAYNTILQEQLGKELVKRLNALDSINLSTDLDKKVKDIGYHEIFEMPLKKNAISSIILPLGDVVYRDRVYPSDKNDSLFKKFMYHLFSSNPDISKRTYITALKNGRGYTAHTLKNLKSTQPFYLESVFSYSRGQTEAVISQLRNDSTIRCESSDLQSLMLNMPPEGYGYALIDRDGRVLFSSKKTRNNFRNLRLDIADDGFVQRGMLADTSQTGTFEYGKDRFNGNISPVYAIKRGRNHPLFLLTYADVKIVEWNSGVSTILTSVVAGIIPLCFIFLIFLWLCTGVGRRKRTAFEGSHSFHFLFPDASKRPEYIFLSAVSVLYIIVLLVIDSSSGLRMIVAAITSTIIMYAMIRILLLVDDTPPKNEDKVSDNSFGRRAKGFYFFLGFLGLAAIVYTVYQDINGLGFRSLLIFNILLFISAYIFKERQKPRASRYESAKKYYTLSMFLWLVAAIIIPVVVLSNWSEEEVVDSFQEMVNELYQEKSEVWNEHLSDKYRHYISKDKWKADSLFTDTLNMFVNAPAQKSKDLKDKRISKEASNWVEMTFNRITNLFESRYAWRPIYSSISNNKKLEKPASFFLAGFAFLVLLFILIYFFFNRLIFNVPKVIPAVPFKYEAIELAIKQYLDGLKKDPIRLYLVGLPGSRREELIESLVEKSKKIVYVNFQWFQKSIDDPNDSDSMLKSVERADIIVIDHWYPCELSDIYSKKLELLTYYFNEKVAMNKGIVLLSSFTITQMEQNWDYLKESDADKKQVKCIVHALSSWIYTFREFVVPLENFTFDPSEPVVRMGMPEVSSYLNKSYYSPIYSGIWNALTQSERFILYDLSDDNLLNTHDKNTLLKLYLKGIIKHNPGRYKLEPFQKSFELFVKYGVSANELYEIEKLSAKNGSWKSFRLGLYLLILTLLIFSYKLIPDTLDGFGTIVGGVLSLVGVMSQLSGKINFQGVSGIFRKSQ